MNIRFDIIGFKEPCKFEDSTPIIPQLMMLYPLYNKLRMGIKVKINE